MTDLIAGVWSGISSFVQAWLLPSAISLGFFSVVLLPALHSHQFFASVASLDGTAKGFLFAFCTLILAIFLASVSKWVLRVLEGYTLWPRWLRIRRTRHHVERRAKLLSDAHGGALEENERALLKERLNSYPRREEYVLPTALGNALKSGETYGWVQHGISTSDLWTRLTSVVDQRVNDQLSTARMVVDLFAALMSLTLAMIPVTVATALWSRHYGLSWWLVALAALVPVWYRCALSAVAWYAQAMRALVDLGRLSLAEALGLELPTTRAEERRLWRAVSNFASWGPGWDEAPGWIEIIDASRRGRPDGQPGVPAPADTAASPGRAAADSPTPKRAIDAARLIELVAVPCVVWLISRRRQFRGRRDDG